MLTLNLTRNIIVFLPTVSIMSSISMTRSNLRISRLTRDLGNIRGFCILCRHRIKRNKRGHIKNLKCTSQVVSETSERGTQTKRNRIPSNVQSVLVLPPYCYELLPPYRYELRSYFVHEIMAAIFRLCQIWLKLFPHPRSEKHAATCKMYRDNIPSFVLSPNFASK